MTFGNCQKDDSSLFLNYLAFGESLLISSDLPLPVKFAEDHQSFPPIHLPDRPLQQIYLPEWHHRIFHSSNFTKPHRFFPSVNSVELHQSYLPFSFAGSPNPTRPKHE